MNSQFNFVSLYNKIPLLRRINQGTKKAKAGAPAADDKGSAATEKNKKEKQSFGSVESPYLSYTSGSAH